MKYIQKALEFRERQADLHNEPRELHRLITLREKLGLPPGDYNLKQQAEKPRYAIRKILAILITIGVLTGYQCTPKIHPGKHTPGQSVPRKTLIKIARPWYQATFHYGFFLQRDSCEALWVPAPGNPKTEIRKYYLIDNDFIYIPQ